MTDKVSRVRIPSCRGRLYSNRPLDELTWLRVGGPAEWLFVPADEEDLGRFLADLDPRVPFMTVGVGSNLIVRDGGIPGVTVRLGRKFARIEIEGCVVRAGAAALDSRVAVLAARAGVDLAFLRTIPGSIGGAVKMNAGCYGKYLADVCREITVARRDGSICRLGSDEIQFRYRGSGLPEDWVVIEAVLEGHSADPSSIFLRMDDQLTRRNRTQPTGTRTAGSTFRNPAGYSSTGRPDDNHDLKAWRLIDGAGMRGARRGNAAVSDLHPNFLVNLGGASATDVEQLGEEVRARVQKVTGIALDWEVIRVGTNLPAEAELPTR